MQYIIDRPTNQNAHFPVVVSPGRNKWSKTLKPVVESENVVYRGKCYFYVIDIVGFRNLFCIAYAKYECGKARARPDTHDTTQLVIWFDLYMILLISLRMALVQLRQG